MDKIKGLDTLRFFAFLAIFIFHATPHFEYGFLGVDFFFVLSSFLLTYLAYNELEKTGSFSRWNFFGRRVLRIFPLYYLILTVSFIAIPIFAPSANLPDNQLLYWLFLSNYEISDSLYALKFLWSISVEEQFYLLFIVLSFLFTRSLLLLIIVLMSCYFTFMLIAQHNDVSTYSNTITHFPNFSAGIIGGYLFFTKKNMGFLPLLFFIASLLGSLIIDNQILFHINLSILFLSLIFIFIEYTHFISKFYVFKLTERLGSYTYGLYVYSGFVISIVPVYFIISNPFYKFVVEFIILLTISVLSYHLYEKQFLKLKKYFR